MIPVWWRAGPPESVTLVWEILSFQVEEMGWRRFGVWKKLEIIETSRPPSFIFHCWWNAMQDVALHGQILWVSFAALCMTKIRCVTCRGLTQRTGIRLQEITLLKSLWTLAILEYLQSFDIAPPARDAMTNLLDQGQRSRDSQSTKQRLMHMAGGVGLFSTFHDLRW